MSKNKNHYEQKAKQKALMGTHAEADSKGRIYKGQDILIGTLGGIVTGIVIGRPSLYAGAAVTGAGYYFRHPMATMFGAGLMVSGGYQTISGMNGVEKTGVDGVKERLLNFKDTIKHQLYLDKIIGKKKEEKSEDDQATNGVGNVQYFKHPGSSNELDFSEADRLEQQIEQSGKQYAQMHGKPDDFSAAEHDDVNGLEGSLEERLM
jgi:hypothetical protein